MAKLDKITIRGFKSIQSLDALELGNLNILIGANGSGKSNFVDLLSLFKTRASEHFSSLFVLAEGVDSFFFRGVSTTKQIEIETTFGLNTCLLKLLPTPNSTLAACRPQLRLSTGEFVSPNVDPSRLHNVLRNTDSSLAEREFQVVFDSILNWRVYHFHDTSMTAGMRRDVGIEQTDSLWPDAGNLAAYLYGLKEQHPQNYNTLKKTLRRIAPFFDDFVLKVTKASPQDTVRLTWKSKASDYVFSPGHFSDGTIRFLCLAAALTQPVPPSTLVLDEPELGLHPEAIAILAGLIRSASARMQVIVTTQSPQLLSEFEPSQVITVDQTNGASNFHRLDPAALEQWLQDYTLGDLWLKGTLKGIINDA